MTAASLSESGVRGSIAGQSVQSAPSKSRTLVIFRQLPLPVRKVTDIVAERRRWTNANLLRGGSISLLVAGDRNFRAQLPARQWGRINQPQSDRGIWSAVTCNRFCRATKKRRLVGALQKKPFGSIRFYLRKSAANLQLRIARSSWLGGRGPQPHRSARSSPP